MYPLPRQRPLDEADTAAQLAAMAASHDRIWTVLWGVAESDPTRFVETWLDARSLQERGPLVRERAAGAVRDAVVHACACSSRAGPPSARTAPSRCAATGWRACRRRAATSCSLPCSGRQTGKVSQRYKVFVHLLGPGDTLWGQRDSEPGGGLRPTTTWKPGETIQDNYGILVLPGTPPGEYMLEIGLYSLETGARLPVRDAQGKPGRRPAAAGTGNGGPARHRPRPGFHRHDAAGALDAGGARLLGYELVQPGGPDPAQVVLYWQAGEAPRPDMTVSLRLTDASGRQVWTSAGRPVLGVYPSSRWQAGEIVRDPHPMNVAGLASGRYGLTMSAGLAGWTELGEVLVQ